MKSVPQQRSDYTRHWCLQYCCTTQRPGHWRRRKFGGCGCLRWQFCGLLGASREENGAKMWMFGRSLVSLATWWTRYGTDDSRSSDTWCACSRLLCPAFYSTDEWKVQEHGATKKEMVGRFVRGFQDCRHHPTGGGVHGEGPTVVESQCLSTVGARRPVRCVVVALSQVSQYEQYSCNRDQETGKQHKPLY